MKVHRELSGEAKVEKKGKGSSPFIAKDATPRRRRDQSSV